MARTAKSRVMAVKPSVFDNQIESQEITMTAKPNKRLERAQANLTTAKETLASVKVDAKGARLALKAAKDEAKQYLKNVAAAEKAYAKIQAAQAKAAQKLEAARDKIAEYK